jgi:tetratricopeptide (TPR) repeat protein
MAVIEADDPEAKGAWRTLERSLQTREDGRLVLAELGQDVDRGSDKLRGWLVSSGGGAMVTQVLGGNVDKIVNIARAEVVNIYQPGLSLPVPRQLPADLGDFSDRKTLLTQIKGRLGRETGSTPIVAISGSGGAGKSSLAIHAACLVRDQFTDGQLFVDLQGQSEYPLDPSDVQATFLRALGVDGSLIPVDPGERGGLFRSALAKRRVLILLDNARDEGQLRPLLPGDSKCGMLITSRRQLLGLEGALFIALMPFPPAESVAMLSKIAGAKRCKQQRSEAEEIARLCDGLPLALRLAGTRLAANKSLPLAKLAASLEDESRRLKELRVGDRTVRASLQLSYDRRTNREQLLFRFLSLLDVQSFAAWVAASVLGSTLDEAETLLTSLVDNQLLVIAPEGTDGGVRYRFHDLIRVLARELVRADPQQDRTDAIGRVLDDYCLLAEFHAVRLNPGGYFERTGPAEVAAGAYPERIAGLLDEDPYQWFSAEFATLRFAIEYCAAAAFPRYAWRLALAVQDFLELQGNLKDWEHLARLGLAAAEQDQDQTATALGHRSLGIALLYKGDVGEAVAELRRALLPADGSGTDKRTAITLRSLGEALSEAGQWDEAQRYFTDASQIFTDLGQPEWAAWTRWSLGVARGVHGDNEGAAKALRQCLHTFELLHHVRGLAVTLRSLSIVQIRLGQTEEAASTLEQCIPLFRSTGDRLGEALAMGQLAELYEAAGRSVEATGLQAASGPYLQQVGSTGGFR